MKLVFLGIGIGVLAYIISILPLRWWMPYSDCQESKRRARSFLVTVFYGMSAVAVVIGLMQLGR
jgi:hypothetical protein